MSSLYALSPLKCDPRIFGEVIVYPGSVGDTVWIDEIPYECDSVPTTLCITHGMHEIVGFSRGRQREDSITVSAANSEMVKFSPASEGELQFLLSSGAQYYFSHDDYRYFGISVEATLVMDSLVYVSLEPTLLFTGGKDGIGGFLNVGRVFHLHELVELQAGAGFGFLKLSFPVKKHRYYCQAKSVLTIGRGTVRGSVAYSLMVGTAIGHRVGGNLVWHVKRRAK